MGVHYGYRPTGNSPYTPWDPYFKYVSLLLNGDGTNGAQNNTFLDSSTNNFTITRNGNTTQGTFSPFSLAEGQWSNYFDGTGDYLSFSGQTFNGDFCAECWFYKTANPTNYSVIFGGSAVTGSNNHQFYVSNTGGVSLVLAATGIINDAGTAVISNQWNHIAWVRSGSNCAIFVNGVRQGTATSSLNTSVCSRIGDIAGLSGYLPIGYISNARIVIGSSVYDPTVSTLTVPTAPLTAITNTQLLTCQSNRFKDNSSNNFTITRNGDTKVTAFSPFAPSAAYSASTNGGSGYFDGSGDYLTVPNNTAIHVLGSDFCLEGWFCLTAAQGNYGLYSTYTTNSGYIVRLDATYIRFYCESSPTDIIVDRNYTFTQGQWYHFAVTNSGGTGRIFVNGVQQGATFGFGSPTNSTEILQIGQTHTLTNAFPGYLSNFRVVKGSSVYTSNFTPSTTPLTAVSGTSLLLNFTNAGIIDNAGKNDIETVGNAQVSTSVKKYGTGSLAFDGTGDSLKYPPSALYDFGSGDCTFEAFIYVSSLAGNRTIVSTIPNASGVTAYSFLVLSSGYLAFDVYLAGTNQAIIANSNAVPLNTWTHVAYTRSGGTNRLFVNGVLCTTSTNNLTQAINSGGNVFYVGQAAYTGYEYYWNGYIDDLRITKGLARYTANFTPPTHALQLR